MRACQGATTSSSAGSRCCTSLRMEELKPAYQLVLRCLRAPPLQSETIVVARAPLERLLDFAVAAGAFGAEGSAEGQAAVRALRAHAASSDSEDLQAPRGTLLTLLRFIGYRLKGRSCSGDGATSAAAPATLHAAASVAAPAAAAAMTAAAAPGGSTAGAADITAVAASTAAPAAVGASEQEASELERLAAQLCVAAQRHAALRCECSLASTVAASATEESRVLEGEVAALQAQAGSLIQELVAGDQRLSVKLMSLAEARQEARMHFETEAASWRTACQASADAHIAAASQLAAQRLAVESQASAALELEGNALSVRKQLLEQDIMLRQLRAEHEDALTELTMATKHFEGTPVGIATGRQDEPAKEYSGLAALIVDFQNTQDKCTELQFRVSASEKAAGELSAALQSVVPRVWRDRRLAQTVPTLTAQLEVAQRKIRKMQYRQGISSDEQYELARSSMRQRLRSAAEQNALLKLKLDASGRAGRNCKVRIPFNTVKAEMEASFEETIQAPAAEAPLEAAAAAPPGPAATTGGEVPPPAPRRGARGGAAALEEDTTAARAQAEARCLRARLVEEAWRAQWLAEQLDDHKRRRTLLQQRAERCSRHEQAIAAAAVRMLSEQARQTRSGSNIEWDATPSASSRGRALTPSMLEDLEPALGARGSSLEDWFRDVVAESVGDLQNGLWVQAVETAARIGWCGVEEHVAEKALPDIKQQEQIDLTKALAEKERLIVSYEELASQDLARLHSSVGSTPTVSSTPDHVMDELNELRAAHAELRRNSLEQHLATAAGLATGSVDAVCRAALIASCCTRTVAADLACDEALFAAGRWEREAVSLQHCAADTSARVDLLSRLLTGSDVVQSKLAASEAQRNVLAAELERLEREREARNCRRDTLTAQCAELDQRRKAAAQALAIAEVAVKEMAASVGTIPELTAKLRGEKAGIEEQRRRQEELIHSMELYRSGQVKRQAAQTAAELDLLRKRVRSEAERTAETCAAAKQEEAALKRAMSQMDEKAAAGARERAEQRQEADASLAREKARCTELEDELAAREAALQRQRETWYAEQAAWQRKRVDLENEARAVRRREKELKMRAAQPQAALRPPPHGAGGGPADAADEGCALGPLASMDVEASMDVPVPDGPPEAAQPVSAVDEIGSLGAVASIDPEALGDVSGRAFSGGTADDVCRSPMATSMEVEKEVPRMATGKHELQPVGDEPTSKAARGPPAAQAVEDVPAEGSPEAALSMAVAAGELVDDLHVAANAADGVLATDAPTRGVGSSPLAGDGTTAGLGPEAPAEAQQPPELFQ